MLLCNIVKKEHTHSYDELIIFKSINAYNDSILLYTKQSILNNNDNYA